MSTRLTCVFGAVALAFQIAEPVHAGQCAQEITAYERAVADLAARGWSAHQSERAQMHRQPTIKSVEKAGAQAKTDAEHDRAALDRARKADALGDETACLRALSQARRHPHRQDR
jgi:hypothetical protein